ncbi:MAG: GDSL-type esterase/lipase family protein [Ignavibacteriaceae bacterium]|nr:GDSL-type esterase/lipase family protein [Ignavibacteriaceae bacterium]
MKKILILLTFVFLAGAGNLLRAQDYLFFTDSDIPGYYDPSWLYSASPSELLKVNGSKYPVSADTFFAGTNALKLQYKSVAGGDWMAAVAAPGWPGRDASLKDSIVMWIYSADAITSQNLPYIFVEDLSNQRSTRIPLSLYNGDIPALTWTKIWAPLDTLKRNPGSADLTRIKTIFLGQNTSEGITRTIFIDNVKMTGGESVYDYNYIVVLGSSTSAGTGANPPDSAWVNRFRTHLLSTDSTWRVANLAVGGFTTYHVMPTGFVPPAGRPVPRVTNNISYALEYNPVAIIINLPSNDAASGYPLSEQIANYDTLVNFAAQRNIRLWITTTQPRNFSSQSQLDALMAMRDSTWSRYGSMAVDFWTEIALSTGYINPLYNSGDGIHLNNAGHRIIYQRAAAKVIPEIVPVELVRFSAAESESAVKLSWETATELNNKGFEIERRIIGGQFSGIGFVPGKGTTSQRSVYTFEDLNFDEGTTYCYRLKQTDFDGSFTYSGEIEVTTSVPSDYMLYQNYPNPFNPETKITFSVPEAGQVNLKVYDVAGNLISTLLSGVITSGKHSVNFNATDLAGGVYFCRMEAGEYSGIIKLLLLK